MRKVFLFNRITLDGFFAGPQGEIDWFVDDLELDKVIHAAMHPDTLLLGRVTYQMFNGYWPHVAADPNASEQDRVLAAELEHMTKVVFSRTLDAVTWANSRLVRGELTQEVGRLKQDEGADIVLFGSGTIVQQLAREGLIDEYLFAVSPLVLGAGKPQFEGVQQFNLKLIAARGFDSGNALLHYRA